MSFLDGEWFKEVKEITFMLRKPTNLPDLSGNPDRSILSMVHKGDKGDIFVEDAESKIMHVRCLSHPDIFYFINLKLENGSEKFFRSNGRSWKECDSKEKSYKYVPEKYRGTVHELKSGWKHKNNATRFMKYAIFVLSLFQR